jgi:hypothetical protein
MCDLRGYVCLNLRLLYTTDKTERRPEALMLRRHALAIDW